jgi:dihydroflavonol-4-reductase
VKGPADYEGACAFVTGATGLLGYAIARALALRGAKVVALTRSGALPGELQALGVHPERGELEDHAALARGLRGATYVFHAAADVRMWRGAWASIHRTNVEGTAALLDAARAANVRRFVFTSTASTIGKPLTPSRDKAPVVDETHAYNFASLGMVYPHTKWLAEQRVHRALDGGLDAVVTHPAAILGPWDWKQNFRPLLRAPKSPLGLFATDGLRSICDVRDVADAHLAAALRGRTGEHYLLAGEAMTTRELLTRIAREVGGTAPRFTLNAGAVRQLGRALDAAAVLTGRPPVLSEEMAIQASFRVVLSSDKAQRELGYRSRAANESIRELVLFHRAQGWLS